MKRLRKFLLLTALLLGAGTLYWWSFTTATVHCLSGNNEEYQLTVAGISLPYSPAVRAGFAQFYAPLISWYTHKLPIQEVRGTVGTYHFEQRLLVVNRDQREDNSVGVGVSVPEKLHASVARLKRNDPVTIRFRNVPMADNPFCYAYELVTLSAQPSR